MFVIDVYMLSLMSISSATTQKFRCEYYPYQRRPKFVADNMIIVMISCLMRGIFNDDFNAISDDNCIC
jgi:hypothetical protein